jgi:hypothetical protein
LLKIQYFLHFGFKLPNHLHKIRVAYYSWSAFQQCKECGWNHCGFGDLKVTNKTNKLPSSIEKWVKTVVTFMSWLDNHLGPGKQQWFFFLVIFFAIFSIWTFFDLQVYGAFFREKLPKFLRFPHTQKVVRFLWWIPVSSQNYRRMLRVLHFRIQFTTKFG